MASNTEGLKRQIREQKAVLEDKYAICLVAARAIVENHNNLIYAEEDRDIKNTDRAIEKHEAAEISFNQAVKDFIGFTRSYDIAVEKITALYVELVETDCAKGAKRARADAERFEDFESYRKDKLFDIVRDISGIRKAYNESAKSESQADAPKAPSVENELPVQQKNGQVDINRDTQGAEYAGIGNASAYQTVSQPAFQPRREYNPQQYIGYDPHRQYAPQGVNIAPASIDISGIVEDAVASAMNKFKAVFEKRVSEFSDKESTEGDTVSTAAAEVSGAIMNMEAEIAESELEIVKKLEEIIGKLKVISDEMINLGASYIDLLHTQKDAGESQKKINDTQRTLVREIQGVQANQKIIFKEQSSVSAEQSALIERQRANAESQAMLNSAQAEVSELQRSITEAHCALAETAKEILSSQKSIISTQHSIMNVNAKNIELQRDLTARQAEANSLQKSVATEHRQLMRKMTSQDKSTNEVKHN